jgi:hypothetical protein
MFFRYHGEKIEAEKYVDRIESKEEKYDLFVDMELWAKAADAAFKLKDSIRLQEVNCISAYKRFNFYYLK